MPEEPASAVDRFREPEYTGENRCVPCTAVNVGIALAASVLVALRSRRVAALAFGGSLLVIYLRGYLVPGTPTLTKRYLPDSVLAAFDKQSLEGPRTGIEIEAVSESGSAPEDAASAAADGGATEWETLEELEYQRENAVDPAEFLLEVNAVEPCERESDLCLTDEFDARVGRELDRDHDVTDRATLAELFDVDRRAVTVKERDYPAIKIGRRIHKWPGTAALATDVATHYALCEQTDEWTAVPRGQRLAVLEALRSFHDACPDCGGAIALTDETVESCCRSYEVLALGCADCEAPLLEFDPKEIGGENGGIEP